MKFLKVLVISSLQYNRMLHSPSLGGKCHIVVATLEVSFPEKCQCLEVNKAQFLHALCYCTKYPVSQYPGICAAQIIVLFPSYLDK